MHPSEYESDEKRRTILKWTGGPPNAVTPRCQLARNTFQARSARARDRRAKPARSVVVVVAALIFLFFFIFFSLYRLVSRQTGPVISGQCGVNETHFLREVRGHGRWWGGTSEMGREMMQVGMGDHMNNGGATAFSLFQVCFATRCLLKPRMTRMKRGKGLGSFPSHVGKWANFSAKSPATKSLVRRPRDLFVGS